MFGTPPNGRICVLSKFQREKKGAERLLEEIMAETSPIMKKDKRSPGPDGFTTKHLNKN